MKKTIASIFCAFVIVITVAFVDLREPAIAVDGPPIPFHVVLDAGHGGRDRGASANGLFESEVNLAVVLELRREFIIRGATVTLTRENENSLANPLARNQKRSDMARRRQIIEQANPNLVLSIHMNTYARDTRVRGLQTFFQRGNEVSRAFAVAIQNQINQTTFPMFRHPKMGDYYVLNETNVPAVLIECGFLTNPDEARLLGTIEYQRFLAHHIVTATLAKVNS